MKKAIRVMMGSLILASVAACSPTPVDIQFEKDLYILEGADSEDKIVAYGVDADGKRITEGLDYTFFCENRDIVRSSTDGTIRAVASGEEEVEAEIIGHDIKKTVKIRVKIPTGIETSHDKLSLWVGQVKPNVAAWVVSEKGAYIEGYTPTWVSADPTIVSVKDIPDPVKGKMQKSYVEMTGLKSGDTSISAVFEGLEKQITVRVYSEDEELSLAGRRKPPAEEQEAEKKGKKKRNKKRRKK